MSDSHLPPPAPLSRSRSTDAGSSRLKASKQEGSGRPSSKDGKCGSARGLGTGASAPSLGGGMPSKHWLMAKDALVQQKEAKKEVRPPHRCDPPLQGEEPWPRPVDSPSLNPPHQTTHSHSMPHLARLLSTALCPAPALLAPPRHTPSHTHHDRDEYSRKCDPTAPHLTPPHHPSSPILTPPL